MSETVNPEDLCADGSQWFPTPDGGYVVWKPQDASNPEGPGTVFVLAPPPPIGSFMKPVPMILADDPPLTFKEQCLMKLHERMGIPYDPWLERERKKGAADDR